MKVKDCHSHALMQPVDLEAPALHDPTTEVPIAQPLSQQIMQPCPCSAFPVGFHTKTPDELQNPS